MSDIYANNLTPLHYEDSNKSGQMIYLYVKTHNITGLKYLGKTVSKDPHKYKGSGKVWKNDCNVHGYNYSTEILFQSIYTNEIKEQGIYYSQLWNIVESNAWANLKPEECDGGYYPGAFTPEANAKRSQTQKGRPQHPDHTAKVSRALKGRKDTRSVESKAQAAAKASAKLKGRKKPEGFGQKISERLSDRVFSETSKQHMKEAWTPERKLAQAERTKALHSLVVSCPHCGRHGDKMAMKRTHFDRCVVITKKYKFIITNPSGNQYKVHYLKEFCQEHNLNFHSITNALYCGRNHYMGWIIQRLASRDDSSS
jgi:hypothetical protein